MKNLQDTLFEQMLLKTSRKVKAVIWELERTQRAYSYKNMNQAYENAFCLAAEAEKLAVMARELPAHTGNPKAPLDLNEMLLEIHDIRIGYTKEGWFSIQLPLLLPNKESGGADYIRTLMYPALHRFFEKTPPVYLDDCVVIFRHVYDECRPQREYRDHDNIEINMVVDLLAVYTMKDDTPLRCQHFYCSAPGNSDRTEVYVIPQKDFIPWIYVEKKFGKTEVKLYEKPF